MLPSTSTLRRSRVLLALLLLAALLGACGGGPVDTGDGAQAPEAGAKRFLSLGTAPAGGAFFVVGGALAAVASEHGPAGWEVTAEATKGSRENIRRLGSGEIDFALSNSAITYFAVRGTSSWDRAYPVRSVMTLAPNVALFVTPKGSGVKTIADLAGKRVVIGPAGAGFEDFVQPIVEAHGLTYDDFTLLNAPQSAAVDMLTDGSADAAFLGGAVPTASLVQAATSIDLHFVPFDPAIKEQLIRDYPFFREATIPAGTYKGLDADYHGLVVGAMHLITAESADEGLVYEFTKAIYENRAAVVERHAAGKSIQPGNVVRQTGTDFHPGAMRYYEEIGIWPSGEAPSAAEAEAAAEGEAEDGERAAH